MATVMLASRYDIRATASMASAVVTLYYKKAVRYEIRHTVAVHRANGI